MIGFFEAFRRRSAACISIARTPCERRPVAMYDNALGMQRQVSAVCIAGHNLPICEFGAWRGQKIDTKAEN
ncbi:MAG TPA: hypothetical protein VKA76_09805 [Gammaproteobacteria bacterium]|nr:hypothetical protein [Gammaproteobacteria bacterium]